MWGGERLALVVKIGGENYRVYLHSLDSKDIHVQKKDEQSLVNHSVSKHLTIPYGTMCQDQVINYHSGVNCQDG